MNENIEDDIYFFYIQAGEVEIYNDIMKDMIARYRTLYSISKKYILSYAMLFFISICRLDITNIKYSSTMNML